MAGDLQQWATSVVLGSGETGYLRPITPADAPALSAFHARQPRENVYRRYFSAKPTLTDDELARFTTVDFRDRVGLVMEIHGEFVGWASYDRWRGRDDAEVAFMVDDAQQGKGIATLMLEHLAVIAAANGITRFNAEVLGDNRPMLSVFARAGWPVKRQFDSGVVELEFPLGDTDHYMESVELREQRADSRAVARLLLPRSIAVIGATDRPGSVGRELWRNCRRGFDGPVFPVNPNRTTIDGVPCYASVTDIDEEVSLAVIAVPPDALVGAVEQCLDHRVRGAVIVTAVDPGTIDIPELVQRARRFGMRIIGPASMGVAMGHAPDGVGVHATLAPVDFPPGRVAMSLQSGTLGSSILTLATRLSIGLSWFVSLGDKGDVSGNDLLQFWEDDEATGVIAIYTETFGNPRKFARIARRVSRRRPIIAVRTGPAAASPAADALYEHAGLIEVPTVRAMMDAARVLATQPVPAGPRVAVLTNSRSPGVLAAAAIAAEGLTVVPPPLPLSWRSDAADYTTALRVALDDDGIDAVLVVFAPAILTAPAPTAEIDAAAEGSPKPVLAVLLGHEDGPIRPGSAVPSFSFPEAASAVLGHMYRYRRWLDTEASAVPEIPDGIDVAAASTVIAEALRDGQDVLEWDDAQRVLEAYGIPVARALEVAGDDDAVVVAAAEAVGFPVAIKSAVRHVGRSAEAGVALDLADAHAVVEAMHVMRDSLGDDASTVLVQRMLHPGIEVRVRGTNDPQIGPVVHVGLGGARADVIGDQAGRLPPLSLSTAVRLVESTRAGVALRAAGIEIARCAGLVVRFGQLVADHPEIHELDANPIMVGAAGCGVADVRIVIAEADAAPSALRRLD